MNYKQAIGIIPARYSSTRLPGKPMADICGKSLIERVWEAASKSMLLSRILIATDSEEIAESAFMFGAEAVLTDPDLPSGSDRCWEAYKQVGDTSEIIINIQGDEPMIQSELIDDLIQNISENNTDVSTAIRKIDNDEDIFDPSVVKVLMNGNGLAKMFTRSPLPHLRDVPEGEWHSTHDYFQHIGIYAYKKDVLKTFTELEPSEMEKAEKLEQLRLLYRGYKFSCIKTDLELIGVDTPEDLEKVRNIFSGN